VSETTAVTPNADSVAHNRKLLDVTKVEQNAPGVRRDHQVLVADTTSCLRSVFRSSRRDKRHLVFQKPELSAEILFLHDSEVNGQQTWNPALRAPQRLKLRDSSLR